MLTGSGPPLVPKSAAVTWAAKISAITACQIATFIPCTPWNPRPCCSRLTKARGRRRRRSPTVDAGSDDPCANPVRAGKLAGHEPFHRPAPHSCPRVRAVCHAPDIPASRAAAAKEAPRATGKRARAVLRRSNPSVLKCAPMTIRPLSWSASPSPKDPPRSPAWIRSRSNPALIFAIGDALPAALARLRTIIAVPRVVKLVNTRDLKSLGRKALPVRVRPRAPTQLSCPSPIPTRAGARVRLRPATAMTCAWPTIGT